MRPLGWTTVAFLIVGIIIYVYLQFFKEMTVQGKVWFIWGVAIWGVISIFLTVWSFFDYYK